MDSNFINNKEKKQAPVAPIDQVAGNPFVEEGEKNHSTIEQLVKGASGITFVVTPPEETPPPLPSTNPPHDDGSEGVEIPIQIEDQSNNESEVVEIPINGKNNINKMMINLNPDDKLLAKTSNQQYDKSADYEIRIKKNGYKLLSANRTESEIIFSFIPTFPFCVRGLLTTNNSQENIEQCELKNDDLHKETDYKIQSFYEDEDEIVIRLKPRFSAKENCDNQKQTINYERQNAISPEENELKQHIPGILSERRVVFSYGSININNQNNENMIDQNKFLRSQSCPQYNSNRSIGSNTYSSSQESLNKSQDSLNENESQNKDPQLITNQKKNKPNFFMKYFGCCAGKSREI